jgi:acyl-ACP thioesterase
MLTTFAMIDLKTRTAVDLNGDIGVRLNECLLPDEQIAVERIPSINRTPIEEVTFKHRPHYSDIDCNRHMNSIRYLDHILDALPIEYVDNHNLTDFVAAYMKEGDRDEELSFGIKEIAPDNFLVRVKKENGMPAANFELKFKPIDA